MVLQTMQWWERRRQRCRYNNCSCSWCFLVLGLINNTPYWIVLSTAKSMSEGGTAVVYICSCAPGLLVKLSAPYWFDRVSYRRRMAVASVCMAVSFFTTSYFCIISDASNSSTPTGNRDGEDRVMSSTTPSVRSSMMTMVGQLIGVALLSVQIGMGEATLLALAGKLDKCEQAQSTAANNSSRSSIDFIPKNCACNRSSCLLSFSSGTGLAGPVGYLWKVSLTEWLGWSVA